MNPHPYLRAFLSGILVPTLIMPLFLIAFIVLRLEIQIGLPIERGIVFPMALVPILWGLWNMLWQGSHPSTHLPVGLHGALLPLFLLPVGTLIATHLGALQLGPSTCDLVPVHHDSVWRDRAFLRGALAGYYLAWKYIVGFVNHVLGIA